MRKPEKSPGCSTKLEALAVGARLEGEPSEQLTRVAFARELEAQRHLASAMSLVDLTHVICAVEQGGIPAEPGGELLQALLELHELPASFRPGPDGGDLYTNREAWLALRTGAVDWLGYGRARREATTAAFLLAVRSGLLELSRAIAELATGMTRVASEHRNALMPDYTYLQAAQPTSFGHYLLGFVYPMIRDLDRVRAAFERVNASPLGCGSTNGTRLGYDRGTAASVLGFDKVTIHARDSMWQADLPIEVGGLLSASVINVDRLAEDLQVFATQEFCLVELSDSHSRASKIMPQKKNPFALTHIRGAASEMIGTMAGLSASARTPSGQPDNRLRVYGQLPNAIHQVIAVMDLMSEVVRELRFNTSRGEDLVTFNTMATDLSDTLVTQSGLTPRQAHHLVGRLVRNFADEPREFNTESIIATARELFGQPIKLNPDALRSALDPHHALEARETLGGAGPLAMKEMLKQCRSRMASHKSWQAAACKRIDEAESRLLANARNRAVRTCKGEASFTAAETNETDTRDRD